MIPAVDSVSGLLPPGIHQATLDEVYDVFVVNAPFRDEREIVFSVLSVYLDILDSKFTEPRYLVNGGFVTHKSWAAPKDVDLAIGLGNQEFKSAFSPDNTAAWTLQGVNHARGSQMMSLKRLQPMLGLVDSHVFARRIPNLVKVWEDQWAKVKGEDGQEVVGVKKGVLEVVR